MLMLIMSSLAAFLVFISLTMKTIPSLRRIGMLSNVAFITYGLLGIYYDIFWKVFPIFVLHLFLLPVNYIRFRESITSTIKAEKTAAHTCSAFLHQFMVVSHCIKGDLIFANGDKAEKLYAIKSGKVRFAESGKVLGAGAFFGEAAFLPGNPLRQYTAVCDEPCELLSIDGDLLHEILKKDRVITFNFIKLLSASNEDDAIDLAHIQNIAA